MKKDFVTVVMNPARQRIMEYLILNRSGTVNDIATNLSDVPRPSVYRHVKLLLDAGCIKITGEKQIRGALEKTYCMAEKPPYDSSNENIAPLVHSALLSLTRNFMKYFKSPDAHPINDMINISSSTLMLSDSEFKEFFTELGQVYGKFMGYNPTPERKTRCVTIISSPYIKNKKGE